MEFVFTAFYDAFPQHRVTLQPRPDGSLLLVLTGGDGELLRKVIEREALYSESCVCRTIHELRRDLKLEAGELVWGSKGDGWLPRELPTYMGGPTHMTAAKTLVTRRKLVSECMPVRS